MRLPWTYRFLEMPVQKASWNFLFFQTLQYLSVKLWSWVNKPKLSGSSAELSELTDTSSTSPLSSSSSGSKTENGLPSSALKELFDDSNLMLWTAGITRVDWCYTCYINIPNRKYRKYVYHSMLWQCFKCPICMKILTDLQLMVPLDFLTKKKHFYSTIYRSPHDNCRLFIHSHNNFYTSKFLVSKKH